jgi:pimeloyl-ACP methyl ester carboxylesterase
MLYTNLPAGIEQKRANVYGSVELDYLEAGPKDGPVIILLHGFPEGAWSWRHQLVPLAEAGWHVVAPDQLGYSGSTAPKSSDAYSSDKLSFHALGLVDHVSGKPGSKAVVVGHDWGSILLSDLARTHPERVLAAIAVSVPLFAPPEPPIEMFRQANGDRYFYIVAFQVSLSSLALPWLPLTFF